MENSTQNILDALGSGAVCRAATVEAVLSGATGIADGLLKNSNSKAVVIGLNHLFKRPGPGM